MRDLLGGKGANVAEMTRILGPERVPAGFTITTEACVAYMDGEEFPAGLDDQVAAALARLEELAGKRLGDPSDPLLVSVRSGARESMPGMLDTVLNLGLNDASVEGLAARTGNERFAWDSYRRFVQMYGNVVLGIEGKRFEDLIAAEKRERGVQRGHRARRRQPARADRRLQGALRLPGRPGRPAAPRDPRRLRLLDRRPRRQLPPHQPHPGHLGHRGERPADGLRQQGRHLRLRRRLQPRRGDRGAGAVGGLPAERAGRGRRLRRADPARHPRAGRLAARGPRAADGHPADARAPLRRHAGHRVHGRGRPPLHAADAQREAAGAGGGALRRRRGRRGAADRASRR